MLFSILLLTAWTTRAFVHGHPTDRRHEVEGGNTEVSFPGSHTGLTSSLEDAPKRLSLEPKLSRSKRHEPPGHRADPTIRLAGVGVNVTHRGRVEVWWNGGWAVICDDLWDIKDADVVCRQLGFRGGAIRAVGESWFGSGSGRYGLDNVECRGTESRVQDCAHLGWGQNNCRPNEAAGVICVSERAIDTSCFGDPNGYRGNVTTTAAGMQCLNWMNFPSVVRGFPDAGLGDHNSCRNPDHDVIPWCFYVADGSVRWTYCTCDGHRTRPLRLVNGTAPGEGRVEIYFNGEWGTICDDKWDDRDAQVVCSNLGYSGEAFAISFGYFGRGGGPVLMDEVECTGGERSVVQCFHSGWYVHDCSHAEDAGVLCESAPTVLTDVPATTVRPDRNYTQPENCGRRFSFRAPPSAHARIVGGVLAARGRWPWVAEVRLNGYGHWCGGALIRDCWVLSAAHCLYDYSKSSFTVRLGEYNLSSVESGEQVFSIERMFLHPDYHPLTNHNDIVLVRLRQHADGTCARTGPYVQPACLPAPVLVRLRQHADGTCARTGPYVQPACLPTPGDTLQPGSNCSIVGWGKANASDTSFSDVLMEASVPFIPRQECRDRAYGNMVTDRMSCAGFWEGGVDTCQGDSGGPLLCQQDDRWTVWGVTSWGDGCARPNWPGVYTAVEEFMSWIQQTIQAAG
ncbi:PRSS12 [Branchiostoma lanceolatum]|uniref:Neurotrypsin n=1 Tax=Branchiostoma lanceolatum TaxID=7740 RepID=A0A8K0EDU5_BRALA|nr:PRSS12 [Branchiostoma lanceolatum]